MTHATTAQMAPEELVGLLDSEPNLQLIDVREPDEFADWRVPGARNIPLAQLAERHDEVDAEARVVLICAKGSRAAEGAQILCEIGISNEVLEGGMGAWASTYDVVEGSFAQATVIQLRRRGKGCLSYVIGAGSRAIVIDPSLEVERYLEIAAAHAWQIRDVLDTHLHADHLSGARDLVARTGATLRLSAADDFTFDFEPLRDGLTIELANGIGLSVSSVAVPGHTEGSTMYQLGDAAIFTGDTIFLESVGRPDLAEKAEEFAHSLYRSIHERVLRLRDDITVFPAHYGESVSVHGGDFVASTLGKLRATLPALALSESEFVAWAVASVKDRPPNYQHIVLVNAGREALSAEGAELEVGPNRCAVA